MPKNAEAALCSGPYKLPPVWIKLQIKNAALTQAVGAGIRRLNLTILERSRTRPSAANPPVTRRRVGGPRLGPRLGGGAPAGVTDTPLIRRPLNRPQEASTVGQQPDIVRAPGHEQLSIRYAGDWKKPVVIEAGEPVLQDTQICPSSLANRDCAP